MLAQVGEQVSWDQVVARTDLPGRVEMVNLASKLGLAAAEVPGRLLAEVGAEIKKGDILAYSKGLFGYFRQPYLSPIDGTIESVSSATGQLILRAPPRPIAIKAYVDGIVEEVEENQGVRLKTYGALIQGIFGLGGETAGELRCLVKNPEESLDISALNSSQKGQVLVVGKIISADMVREAARLGIAAVVAGGVDDSCIRELLGYDLGVAITGNEKLGVTLLVTEGFGALPMASKTFDLLREREGKRASVSGATQIRAGVIRPEIIVTDLDGDWEKQADEPPELELAVDVPVRLIREPHFGSLAKVIDLPVQPVVIPSGAKVRVAEVQLDDGTKMTIPRANLELIEG